MALAKALPGASLVPPRPESDATAQPLALLSIADRDKPRLPRSPRRSSHAGYRLAATAGHAGGARAPPGTRSIPVAKLGAEPDPAAGEIGDPRAHRRRPTSGSSSTRRRRAPAPIRDAAEIRHAAIAEGILCLTAIETAIAAAEALDPQIRPRIAEVRSLSEWVPEVQPLAAASA